MKWELEDLAFKALEPERFRELAKLLDTRRKGRESYIERAIAELAAAARGGRHRGRPRRAARSTSTASGRRCSARARSSARSTTSTPSASWSTTSATATRRSASSTRSGGRSPASSTTTSRSPRTTSTSRSTPRSSRSTASRSRSRSGPTQMHQVSEVGIAAHWRYKEGTKSDREYDAKLAWLRQLHGLAARRLATRPSSSRASSSTSSRTRSSCSRPKGDIKDLPAGATPLDFAYRIHTDVGHRTIGAKVNNRLVPLDYRLKNGDIVEIVTTKGEHGPSRDWMNVVRTSHAREKIRQWFKRKDRDENIVHGRESLERELRRLARTSIAAVGPDRIAEVARAVQLRDARRLLRRHRLRRGRRPDGRHAARRRRRRRRARSRRSRRRSSVQRTGGVRVKGVGDLLVRFAKCCHPIPGDPIVGFITRGKGVTVHLQTCPTVVNEREVEPAHRGRVGGRADRRPTRSRSGSRPTTGPACSATSPRSSPRTRSTSWPRRSAVTPDHTAVVTATLQVHSVSQLARVMSRIETLKDVITRPARPRLRRSAKALMTGSAVLGAFFLVLGLVIGIMLRRSRRRRPRSCDQALTKRAVRATSTPADAARDAVVHGDGRSSDRIRRGPGTP